MRYRAFFSYARADDKIANWLHRQLDGYRTPKSLVGTGGEFGPVPPKLHPIFRDRTDLEAGGHVDAALQQALEDSKTLIVLCTPTSAKSHWVNHEVETFLKLGREGEVFPVIAGGVPDSGDPETECFPPALRGKGLLAADLREIKLSTGQLVGDGREGGRLKLIAGLLGVKLDALVQRERRRQRQLMAALGTAVLVFAGVAFFAGMQTLYANTQRRAAEENARQVRTTLHRFFATRSWEENEAGMMPTAVRYSLAGMQLAKENEPLYRAVLSASMHAVGESSHPMLHDRAVKAGAFSPDGSRVATASDDNTAKIWEAADNTLLTLLAGHQASVNSVAFSPDGSQVLTASDDKTAAIWDSGNAQLIRTLQGHTGPVRMAAFSPDGSRLVTASSDGTARIWNASNGQVILTLSNAERSARAAIYSAAFSPDGRQVLTSNSDGTARIWNAENGDLTSTLIGHKSSVLAAAFSADGTRIVTGSSDNTAIIWSVSDAQPIVTLQGHTDSVLSAAFSGDGNRVVTGSGDNTARVWNSKSGQSIRTLRGHEAPVSGVSFSPDSAHVITASADRTAKIWDVSATQVLATLNAHDGEEFFIGVSSASFSPDGTRILTTEPGETIQIWETSTGRLLAAHRVQEDEEFVLAATFAKDGVRAVTGANAENRSDLWIPSDVSRIWNASSGHLIAVLQGAVDYAAFSLDGTRVVTASGNDAKIWNANTGGLISTLQGHEGAVVNAAFSTDGRRIVTSSGDKTARVWDAVNGSVIAVLEGHKSKVVSAAFSPNGDRVVTGSNDKTARIWNATSGKLVVALQGRENDWWNPDGVVSASFSADGTRVVTAHGDTMARVWDASDGQLIATLSGHKSTVRSAVFSQDGARVVTASDDHTAIVWDTRRLTQDWPALARDACVEFLGPYGRRFSQTEFDSEQLLIAEWRADRDVCAGVPGVPSIAELRRRAGLPAAAQ